jgi:hypothetical protein
MLQESADYGAQIEYLCECLEEDSHTVIFTAFAMAQPFIVQALTEKGFKNIYTLRGGTDEDVVIQRVVEFKATRGIMICTIAFAQSFRLDTVKVAYIAGFSWDPSENYQAEGRLRDLNSDLPEGVLVKYLVTQGTVEDRVRDVVNGKVYTIHRFLEDTMT